MARRSKVQVRKSYSKMLGEDLVAKLSDDQIVILSKYYNSLDAKETSDVDSKLIQGRNDTVLHEMARDMVGDDDDEEDIPEGLDDILGSIQEPKVTTIKSSAIVAAKFFGEDRYAKYREELVQEGTIDGEQLSPEERKEGFKSRNNSMDFEKFIGKILEKKNSNEEVAGGEITTVSNAPIVVKKDRITADNLKPEKPEGEENLDEVGDKIDDILGVLRKQFDLDKKEEERKRRLAEKGRRGKREDKMESRFAPLAKLAKKALAPAKSFLDKILNFIKTVLLGRALMGILDWMGNPENQDKIKSIIRFFKDWWPTLLGAYVLFGTNFGKFVRTITSILIKSTAKLLKVVLPKLLTLVKANPVKAALVAGGALAAGGAYIASQQNEKRRSELDAVDDDAVVTPKETREEGQMPGASQLMQEQILQRGMGMAFGGGGEVDGPGGIDKVPAMLTDGEFVMSKGAVQKYGLDTLESMNAAGGGNNMPRMLNNIAYASGGGLIGELPERKDGHEHALSEPLGSMVMKMNTGGEATPIEKMEFNPDNYFEGPNIYNSKRIENPGQTGKSFFVRYAQNDDGSIEVRQVNKVVKDGNLFNGFTPDLTGVKPGSDEFQKVVGSANTKGVIESELKDRAKFTTRSSAVSKEMKPERDKVNAWIKGGKNLSVSPHAMVGYDYNQSFQTTKTAFKDRGVSGKKGEELSAAAAAQLAMPNIGDDKTVLPTSDESRISTDTINQYTIASTPQNQGQTETAKPKSALDIIKAFLSTGLASMYGRGDQQKENSLNNVITGRTQEEEGRLSSPSSGYGSQGSKIAGNLGKYIESNLMSAAKSSDGYGDYLKITEHPDFGGVRGKHANGSYHDSGRALDIGAYTNEQGKIVKVINQFNRENSVKPVELITGARFQGTTIIDPAGQGDHVHVAYNKGGEVDGPGGIDKVPAMLTDGEFVVNKPTVRGVGLENLLDMNKEFGGPNANKPKVVGAYNSGGQVSKMKMGTKNVKPVPITPMTRSQPKLTVINAGSETNSVTTQAPVTTSVPSFSASSADRTKANTLGIINY